MGDAYNIFNNLKIDTDLVRPDGRGNIPDYDVLFPQLFQEYFYTLGVDVNEEYKELDTSRKAGALTYISKKLFIDNSCLTSKRSILSDNMPLLYIVLDSFKNLCLMYNIIPNFQNLGLCTGINRNYFVDLLNRGAYNNIIYNTSDSTNSDNPIYNNSDGGLNGSSVYKRINRLIVINLNELQHLADSAIEGRLLDCSSPVGTVAVANNSKNYGLQWAVNRAYNTATARKLVDSGGAAEDFQRFLESKGGG